MRKIRIGKDIACVWPILTNGSAQDLADRDLKLYLVAPHNWKKQIAFTTDANRACFTISGRMQHCLGSYGLELWENKGKDAQTIADLPAAFELVAHNDQESDGTSSDIQAATINLGTSTLAVGVGQAFIDSVTEQLENKVDIVGEEPVRIKRGDFSLILNDSNVMIQRDHIERVGPHITHQTSYVSINADGEVELMGDAKLNDHAVITEEDLGSLSDLTTSDKTTIVAAINEINEGLDNTIKNDATDEGDVIINGGSQIVLQADDGSAGFALVEGGAVQLNGSSITANNKPIATTDQLEAISAEITDLQSGKMATTPSGDPLHYMYVSAGAEYNATSEDITKTAPWGDSVLHKAGKWYMNGIGDLSGADMRAIILQTSDYTDASFCAYKYFNCEFRTNIRRGVGQITNVGQNAAAAFQNMLSIEVLNNSTYSLYNYGFTNALQMFQGCIKLVAVLNPIILKNNTTALNGIFGNCAKLKYVKLHGLKVSVSIAQSPLLLPECVAYMINNAQNATIVITLHATAYANAMADADVTAALAAHTNVSLASA